MPRSSARGGELDDVVDRAELRVRRRCGRRRRRRSPTGCPVSSGVGVERVVAALAVRAPDRVDRRQVDDVEAHVGDVVEAVDGVGERAVAVGAGATVERGKNSYQALNRARVGSTSMSTGAASCGRGLAHAGAPEQGFEVDALVLGLDVLEVGDVAVAVRDVGRGEVTERAGVAVGRGAGAARSALGRRRHAVVPARAASIRPMPICRSTATSTPASSLSSMPWRHVPRWSSQPTTWYCQRPSRSGTNVAAKRSLPSGTIGISCHPRRPMPDAQGGGGAVVAVGEDVGEDGDRLVDRRLGRERPAVDERRDRLDDDPARTPASAWWSGACSASLGTLGTRRPSRRHTRGFPFPRRIVTLSVTNPQENRISVLGSPERS